MPDQPQFVVREYAHEAYTKLIDQGLTPVAARVLASRQITTVDELDPSLDELPPITGDAATAAELIVTAIRDHKHICIIGDYDADGMCATALAVLALQQIEVTASWLLVNRSHDERSLDPVLVEQAAQLGAEVIVTVDGGTSAHAGVAAAKQHGIQVIVTDHHLVDTGGPAPAAAIANPQLATCGFPAQDICGTTVIMLVMREVYRLTGATRPLGVLMDLVAVATVADVMPLDDPINRKFVMAGLKLIQNGRCRNAFKAILRQDLPRCNTKMIGFKLAPILNAANRVDKPEKGVALLLCDDIRYANELAAELVAFNRTRRTLTANYTAAAKKALNHPEHAIVAYAEDWRKGIIGVVASRLTDEYDLPAAVLAGPPGDISGSLRSVRGISVHQVLTQVEAEAPDLLGRWGGHAAAAGMQLNGSVERFRELFSKHVAAADCASSVKAPRHYDGELSETELCAGSFAAIADVPWGKNFPAPVFGGTFQIEECRPTSNGNGYRFQLGLGTSQYPAWSRKRLGAVGNVVQLRYSVQLDNYSDDGLFILPEEGTST